MRTNFILLRFINETLFFIRKKIDLQAQEHTELQFVLPIGINVSFTLTLSNAAHKNFSNFF